MHQQIPQDAIDSISDSYIKGFIGYANARVGISSRNIEIHDKFGLGAGNDYLLETKF